MNIKDWPPEMCIAHLTLHGWVPRTQAVIQRGLRNGLVDPNRAWFWYEWGVALERDTVDEGRARVGWDHGEWFRFSTTELRLFVEKCDALS